MKITKDNITKLLTQYVAQFYGEGSVIDSWVLQTVDDDHGSIGDIMCNISSANAGKVYSMIDAHDFRKWAHALPENPEDNLEAMMDSYITDISIRKEHKQYFNEIEIKTENATMIIWGHIKQIKEN
jgi:hypothetical protein